MNQGGLFGRVSAASSSVEGLSRKTVKNKKGKYKLLGKDILFKFTCTKDSNLGKIGGELGIKVIRLCKEDIDLEHPESIAQLKHQVQVIPGYSI